MRLFRKHHTPGEVGAMVYETIRAGLASDGELSVRRLLETLDLDPGRLHEQYVGEIMIGSMFGGALAVERSTSPWMAQQICNGMTAEFLQHLKEQGADDAQVSEWEVIAKARFLEYRNCLEGYEGYEPPWKLGRQFFWNVSGVEEYVAMSIKIATLYLLAIRDMCQSVINQYGPTLAVNFAT